MISNMNDLYNISDFDFKAFLHFSVAISNFVHRFEYRH